MYHVGVDFAYAAAISTGGATTRVATLGTNPDIDTTTQPEDVWAGAELGTVNGIDHRFIQFPSAATSMEIVSSSASDAAAGAGARTVLIQYLDANYNRANVVVTMNGVTPVVIGPQMLRINAVIVATAGTTPRGSNVGNISVRAAGGLGATYSYMLAGQSIARSSLFTVPDKLEMDLMSMFISINRTDTSARAASFSLCIQNSAGRLIKGLELSCTSDVSYRHEAANVPLNVIAARTDVWLTCESVSVSNTNVTGSLFGYTRNAVNFGL